MVGETALSGKYTAYPEYKDSGVKWLGVIPTEWELWKLNHAYDEIGSGTTPPSGSDEWYGGDVPWVTTGELRETEIISTTKNLTQDTLRRFPTLRKYPKGSIAIAMYGATIGRLGIFGIEATTNQACCVLAKSHVVDNKYLYYWFQAFRQDIVSLASGGGQPNINQEVVASLKISSPDVTGQRRVANFLDHETAKIDSLIDKQQKLITLLKEKRQAVISHAVTKGLNPNAPMRDSGVESIGIMPEHWTLKSLSLASKKLAVGLAMSVTDSYEEEGVPIIRNQNIKEGYFDGGDMLYLNPDFAEAQASKKVKAGDVVIVRTGSNVGLTCCVPDEYDQCHTFTTLIVTPSDELVKEYFTYCMNSAYGKAEVSRLKFGFGKDNLNVGELRSMHALLPSVDEQKEIVSHLEQEVYKIELIIKKANIAIGLMQERRTALISAAVTGKIDVRNWQAPATTTNKEVAA
jgi:type I restriction enzyme S subunit